ncbi:Swt1 family HEPN domain-containing protein [Tessaracoccus massiliensis]|uniref:Swt1 family HEPN domain-containing protein n=1 Tax=Tessaracoccus massiliensis TaxID=1522311 RepID=UPI000A893DAE|nr:Swt1 family HEPN domain-containing protein [Tessaracoccus massiliensis]
MTFKPNLSVKEGLDHLAKRLDPIIAAKLADNLGGHPWTVVLEILDQKKGFTNGYKYWTYDLQAQLRMLTEKLGDFGYPFDDKQRTVSTLGNELRIVRKQMAHMHEFTVDEAFRANDFAVRLLEHFDDADGLEEAKRIRHEALAALATQEGVTEQVAAETALTLAVEEAPAAAPAKKPESVTPDPEVFIREPSVIGDKRLEFEAWSVVQVGGVDVLDDLPKKVAKEKLRAVAVEIATYEGPIHPRPSHRQDGPIVRTQARALQPREEDLVPDPAGRPVHRRGQVRLAPRNRPGDVGRVPSQRQRCRPPVRPYQPN